MKITVEILAPIETTPKRSVGIVDSGTTDDWKIGVGLQKIKELRFNWQWGSGNC